VRLAGAVSPTPCIVTPLTSNLVLTKFHYNLVIAKYGGCDATADPA
jgi:hypothetical protein